MNEKILDQDTFLEIERYILNEMSPRESKDFEVRMKEDVQLARDVQIQRDSMLAVELHSLTETLNSIAENGDSDTVKKGLLFSLPRTGLLVSIAAGIAILFGLFSIWNPFQTKHESLYAEYYSPDPGLPVPMSATDHYDFYDAMVDYRAENYDAALEKWSKLQEKAPENDTLQYFIASTLLNMESHDEALPILEKLSMNSASVFRERATWYSALIYLKKGQTEKVKSLDLSDTSKYSDRLEELKSKTP